MAHSANGPIEGSALTSGDSMAKKLKKAELKVYKERLLAVRARLRGDVNAMASTALKTAGDGNSSSAPLHMADIGSENFEQEFTLSLMQSEEETLEMIEKALERVESCLLYTSPSPRDS